MEHKSLSLKESVALIVEVESQLEKLRAKRKDEVEKELNEKIRLEQEQAERKLGLIEKEFEKEKVALEEYRTLLSEFENERTTILNQIKEHFDKAVHYQTEIGKIAGLTLEQLRMVGELNKKLEELEGKAEEKIGLLRKDLEGKFGIITQVPEMEEEDLRIDLDQELLRLRKIKELLESGTVLPENEALVGLPGEAQLPELRNEREIPFSIPEINEVIESSLAAEEAPPAPPEPEEFQETREESFKDHFEKLEKYRDGDAGFQSGDIRFYRKDEKGLVDGQSLMTVLTVSLEETRKLFLRLKQTDSPKDLFSIKQEIIVRQEILRKHMDKVFKMCEKQGFFLPRFTSDILNLQVLRSILERLSIENWSNESDFNSFKVFAESLGDAFYEKITPPATYLRSIIEELGVW